MAKSVTNLCHHLLVATPNLIDTHFSKSVIYICKHDHSGILGVMVNKPLGIAVHQVLDCIKSETESLDSFDPHRIEQDVMMGGPVGVDQGFILYNDHCNDEPISISSSTELLEDIARGNGPDQYLLSLGYAGWDEDDLNDEIKRHDWHIIPVENQETAKLIFDVPAEMRWNQATELLGYPHHSITHQVGHA